jgi:hypothetical protein
MTEKLALVAVNPVLVDCCNVLLASDEVFVEVACGSPVGLVFWVDIVCRMHAGDGKSPPKRS